MQDVLDQVRLDQRLRVEAVAMLRGDEDALDLDRPLVPVLVDVVADGHLRLPVGPQVRQDIGLAHLREALADPVREHDRQRHQLVGLTRGVAEHHPLVAGADPVERVLVAVLRLERVVDPLRDVRRLLVDRDDHTAGLGVEAVLRARVADLRDRLAHEPRDVHVRLGRDLARHDDEAGRDQRLAGDAPGWVVGENRVEDRVRDLVGDLVRMPLGDGLRGELKRASGHRGRVPTRLSALAASDSRRACPAARRRGRRRHPP